LGGVEECVAPQRTPPGFRNAKTQLSLFNGVIFTKLRLLSEPSSRKNKKTNCFDKH